MQTESVAPTAKPTPDVALHGYLCFHKSRKVEVRAASSYAAQVKAANALGAKKAYEVIVALCERPDGSQVTHTPDF